MKYIYWMMSFFIFSACSGKAQQETSYKEELKFQMVSVPSMLIDPQQRADYLADHYWDNFDFTDTAYINLPKITEQAFADYIQVLSHTTPGHPGKSIHKMLHEAEKDTAIYSYFISLYEKYLYEPNSPLRNEELYIPVLEYILNSSTVGDIYKVRPAYLLELINKNRLGKKANDFTYTLTNGKRSRLYDIKADYTILYFYNPDCETCNDLTRQLSQSSLLNALLDKKKLIILAVYPDEDLAAWKNHISEIPVKWINAYDDSMKLENEEIYDLKAIPTIYLLDKNKTVLLKDTTFEQLEEYLYTNSQI